MGRFDGRDKDTFKKDIKYGTMLEKFWMDLVFCEMAGHKDFDGLISYCDNGVDNTGGFKKKSSGAADYKLTFAKRNYMPLEVKWCPTKGKATFKKHDLERYVEQNASILFIYNNNEKSLKKPKDRDYKSQQKLILEHIDNIFWGVIYTPNIEFILEDEKEEKIRYMGGKQGFIIPESRFDEYVELFKFDYVDKEQI